MKKLFYKGAIVLGIISLSIAGCKKNSTTTETANTDDNTEIEAMQADESVSDDFITVNNNSADTQVGGLGNIKPSNQLKISALPNVISALKDKFGGTITGTRQMSGTTLISKTVTVDYGTGTTTEEVARKGKIITKYNSKSFAEPGANITITFEGFSVNGNTISGTRSITNNGNNAAGNPTFTTASTITRMIEGVETKFNSTRTMEWIEGKNTPDNASDDKFSITGNSSGVNRRGKTYTLEITKPLIKVNTCRFIVSGISTLKVNDKTKTLDYGDETCNTDISVSVNGVIKKIRKAK
ncbi:MAG: hypothetical protein K2Q03_02050 [Sphingobacteriaceae bacterium]|nr:hypothetical protein [Sphingobacteriaceae bacterium]